jgi:1-acyl-sn-glycerol-3-phosphate acyltransferase
MRRPDLPKPLAARGFPFVAPNVPAGVEPPKRKKHSGAEYETEWARNLPSRFARVVLLEAALRPVVATVARPERKGIDRLVDLMDDGGPVIFAANHHSHVDTPLLLTSIPEPWRYRIFVGAAADYFFPNRVLSVASALALNAIPIERTKVSRRAADQATELIQAGWSMLIYPEGGRSPDGWGQEFRGGAAYLARRCGVPVVPVHIEGTGRILRKGAKKLTPSPTTVTFGPPLHPGDEDTRTVNARIESAIAALADEVAFGFYEAATRAHAGRTTPLSGPAAANWRRAWALGNRGPKRRPPRRWPDL